MSHENEVAIALDLITKPFGSRTRGALAERGIEPLLTREATQSPSLRELYPWAMEEHVIAYGVAEKETCGKRLAEIALKVYVEEKLPLGKIAHPVPKQISFDGLPPILTDVESIGRVAPQSYTQRVRPAVPGYSVGRATQTTDAGTLGMLVRKKGQRSPFYLLSNCHAIAAFGSATKGDVIIQPGTFDGGSAQGDAIGTLEDWVPFEFSESGFPNLVDAAIARMNDGVATPAIAQLGVPKAVNTNTGRGMYVQKIGRTTQLSVARVQDVHLRISQSYLNGAGQLGRVGFSDQVLTTFYSAPGDSGSPVLNMDNEVVGLHVAGSAVVGIFCKIGNVMDALGIEVVTQQNLGEDGSVEEQPTGDHDGKRG